MAVLPPYLIPASRLRRFCAGLLNFMSAGFVGLLTGTIATGSIEPSHFGLEGRLWALGLLTVLWVIYIAKRKSVGAAFCLLEIRCMDGAIPGARQMVARSWPVVVCAVLWSFPAEVLPRWGVVLWLVTLLGFIVGVMLSGIVGIVSGSSLLDRLSKTMLLQLKLPEHAKPRVFGLRII